LGPAARASLRGGEGEWSSWGCQCGIRPVSRGPAGPATFRQNKGDEGLLLYHPHGVVAGETLNMPHDRVYVVRQEASASRHVGQNAGHFPPLTSGTLLRLRLEHAERDKVLRVHGGVGQEEGFELGVAVGPGRRGRGTPGGITSLE